MTARLAVDIGGTFTDLVFTAANGRIAACKVSTTPADITVGILAGISKTGVAAADLDAFVHGTTIALNALLEGKTPRVGLITTNGFRDVLEIMRTNRPIMYDLQQEKPVPLVPRRDRLGISARMTYDGATLTPVDPEEVRAIARMFRERGIGSIAVCLLHAYANPQHEQEVAQILREELPDATLSVSSDVSRMWREFERTSTTVSNAATKPIVGRYLGELERKLGVEAFQGQVLIMQSNGGVMSASEARERPVSTLMSGPVGGVTGALEIARLLGGETNLVTLDIGGTSADVAIVDRGEAVTRTVGHIGRWPVMVPMVDIESIGAGGRLNRPRGRIRRAARRGKAPAPTRGPPATAAVAPMRRSPTRTSCSAGSIPRTSSAETSIWTSRRPSRRCASTSPGRTRWTSGAPRRGS